MDGQQAKKGNNIFSFMVLSQYVSIYSKGVTGIWYLVLLYIVRNILARGSVGYIMRLDFIWNKDKLLFSLLIQRLYIGF